jgi:hypothetical protein
MAARGARAFAVCVIAAAAACSSSVGPTPLLPPKDPGTIVVQVSDQNDAPVLGVAVTVSDIPNGRGRSYSLGSHTDANGTATFTDIDAGSRRVAMAVPFGYSADPLGSSRQVTVVKDATVVVDFRISLQ